MAEGMIANGPLLLMGTVIGCVALVMLLESLAPLRAEPKAPLLRWISNLTLTAVDYAVLFGLTPLISILIAQTPGFGNVGLLHQFEAGYLVSFIVVLLCLDFLNYWLHRALHAVPILWRLHAVHHSDVEVDATTTYRHHPLELVASTLVTVPVLMMLGPDPLTLLGFNIFNTIVTVLIHGNISLGKNADRLLRLIIVTPDFHRLHHSAERRHTDSNYAGILPLFDYLFRTASWCPAEQHKTMTLGLPYFREPKYTRLDQLLLMPFRKFATVQA